MNKNNIISNNDKYVFWLNDPEILYKNQKYLEFAPTSSMSRIEQLNSITRFCIYFLILAYITKKDEIWIQFTILIIIFISVLYFVFESDSKGKINELYRTKNMNLENFTDDSEKTKYDNMDDDTIIESGYYDSDNNLYTNTYQKSHSKTENNAKYNLEEYEKYKNDTCRIPTPENPFMNPTLNDIGLDLPPEPCNVDDELIQDKITNAFNDNLFRDVSDLFERQNSQRQYYTVPGTNPPDTISFANWLYKTENICKIDQSKCLKYEDIRYKR